MMCNFCEEKEKEEEEQETEYNVEVSGTFHVMATSEEEAERFIFEMFCDGYYLSELEISAGED